MDDTKQGTWVNNYESKVYQNYDAANQAAIRQVIQMSTTGTEMNLAQLQKLREGGKRFYALKCKSKFFLLPKKPTALRSAAHLCSFCRRCHALPSSKGGCDKVYVRENKKMERFPFVILAVEEFFPRVEEPEDSSFYVLQCQNFEPDPIRESSYIWRR